MAHLYSCRCLDDLLIKYRSPALRMRVVSTEMGVHFVPGLILCLPKDYVLALAEEGNGFCPLFSQAILCYYDTHLLRHNSLVSAVRTLKDGAVNCSAAL